MWILPPWVLICNFFPPFCQRNLHIYFPGLSLILFFLFIVKDKNNLYHKLKGFRLLVMIVDMICKYFTSAHNLYARILVVRYSAHGFIENVRNGAYFCSRDSYKADPKCLSPCVMKGTNCVVFSI